MTRLRVHYQERFHYGEGIALANFQDSIFRLVQSFSVHVVQGDKCGPGRLSRIHPEINLPRRPGVSRPGTRRGVALMCFQSVLCSYFFESLSRKKGQILTGFLHCFIKFKSEVTCT